MEVAKRKVLMLAATVVLAAPAAAAAQVDVRAATRAAPERLVVLIWSEAPAVSRYNLYRKTDSEAAWTRLNPQPLAVLTDPAAITALIPPGGPEWNLLAKGLADSPGLTDFDPLAVATIPRGTEKWLRLQMLAQGHRKIAALVGQGYVDSAVVAGQGYSYQVRGVDAAGTETGVLSKDVSVTAGSPVLFPPPAGLTAQAGDSKVLLWWNGVPGAAGFRVDRASATESWVRVDDGSFTAQIDTDLDGEPVVPGRGQRGGVVRDSSVILASAGVSTRNGFVDFQRYDDFGNPIPHEGTTVDGPVNGTTYYYQVTSLDLLGQGGSATAPVVAEPLDLTAPQAPQGLEVTASETTSQLELRWLPVTRDVEGHPEAGIAGYRIFRYQNPSDPNEEPVPVGGLVPPPATSATDADPLLRSLYGEDRSQNKIGSWPSPGETVVCERLRDRTAPEPAILSGLSARNRAVLVEWIGPPVQDIGAYHVYRSEAEGGPYVWVGGAMVESLEPLAAPYAPATSGCASISLIPRDSMSAGFFIDKGTEPKRIYWYKVVGIDQAGNEAPLDRAAPVSTFTFDTAAPLTPTLTAIASSRSPGGLLIQWAPRFDLAEHRGFLVYRSRSAAGPFLQIGSLVAGSTYLDTAAAEGVTYWYRVAQMNRRGELSELSPPLSARVAP